MASYPSPVSESTYRSTMEYLYQATEVFDNCIRYPLMSFYEDKNLTEKATCVAFKAFAFFAACYTNHPIVVIGLVVTIAANLTQNKLMTNEKVKDIFHGVAAAYFLTILRPLAEVVTALTIAGSLVTIAYKYDSMRDGIQKLFHSSKKERDQHTVQASLVKNPIDEEDLEWSSNEEPHVESKQKANAQSKHVDLKPRAENTRLKNQCQHQKG